jgi:uncharacterized protein YbaR (Trm112 family)
VRPRGNLYSLDDGSLEEFADILNSPEDRRCLFCFEHNTKQGFVVCEKCNESALYQKESLQAYCLGFAKEERLRLTCNQWGLFYSSLMVAGDLYLEIQDT